MTNGLPLLRQSQEELQAVQALRTLLTEQANRYFLTGLYNRRYLNNVLRRELGASAGRCC